MRTQYNQRGGRGAASRRTADEITGEPVQPGARWGPISSAAAAAAVPATIWAATGWRKVPQSDTGKVLRSVAWPAVIVGGIILLSKVE